LTRSGTRQDDAPTVDVERKLTAILCADVHGYSRLMGEDEEATVRTLSTHRAIIDGLIEQHRGRFVNSAGDSVLAEFASVVNAVECAVEIQTTLKAENTSLPPKRRMEFRIGVNLGDVVVEGKEIYGDGINVAARLESLAEPGGIYISGKVREEIRNKLVLTCEDFGEQQVKNIAEPVRVFRVLLGEGEPATRKTRRFKRKYLRRGAFPVAGLAMIAAIAVLVQHVSLRPPRTSASIPAQENSVLPLPNKPSIAVLPFTNLSGDHEQEYFSDGITDDLITDLSRLPGLFVIAHASSFTYKGKSAALQDVRKQLGVKYVLQGSVRRAGEEVRITVQLADATNRAELWAERYDRPLRDVFAVQDEIVQRIITTLNLQLALSQRGFSVPRTTDNLDAYDDLLRGIKDSLSLTKDGNSQARAIFEKAIALDPKYAVAYEALGANYFIGWVLGVNSDPKGLEQAFRSEQQAVALDESLATAHSTLAEIYAEAGQYGQAIAEVQRAIALDPNSAQGYFWLADILNFQWKPADALSALGMAMRLDPRNPVNYLFEQGRTFSALGKRKEAIPALKEYLASYPDHLWAHAILCDDYSLTGDEEGARTETAAVERIVASNPNTIAYAALAEVLVNQQRPTEGLAAVDKAASLDPGNANINYLFQQGEAYTVLGRAQEAISVWKHYLASFPDNSWAHALLAADYVETRDDAAARAEVAQVLKRNPQLTAELVFPPDGLPQKLQPEVISRLRGDLHKAGLK
jgi:adenylate cyclase